MRVTSGSLIIGTTPTQVDGNSVQPCVIKVRNNDSTKTLFIGNSSVTVESGLPIDKLATLEFKLPPGESLYMVSSETGHSVSWLRITE